MVTRRVAVAVPALNERENIVSCVSGLLAQAGNLPIDVVFTIHILANNCSDGTAAILRERFGRIGQLHVHEITLPASQSNAGWARRIALELAANDLQAPDDLILSTDADTIVAPDWAGRSLRYFAAGYDAVAGIARIPIRAHTNLTAAQNARLIQITKYQTLVAYLRRDFSAHDDPWPSHNYEGGASIALTKRMYDMIGGCPPLPCGEDRALFEAVRSAGGRIRHARDVRVSTSGRQIGRAKGGTADTLRLSPAANWER